MSDYDSRKSGFAMMHAASANRDSIGVSLKHVPLGAKVQTLLPVRPTGRQLTPKRKPAAPRRPTQRHRILRLDRLGQREELMTQLLAHIALGLTGALGKSRLLDKTLSSPNAVGITQESCYCVDTLFFPFSCRLATQKNSAINNASATFSRERKHCGGEST